MYDPAGLSHCRCPSFGYGDESSPKLIHADAHSVHLQPACGVALLAYILLPGCLDSLQLSHLGLYGILRLTLLLLSLPPLFLQLPLYLQ